MPQSELDQTIERTSVPSFAIHKLIAEYQCKFKHV